MLDKKFAELEVREKDEQMREREFALSVEEAKQSLEEERKQFEAEKEEFEKTHQEEPDSGIGSRNDSAEVYEADEEEEGLSHAVDIISFYY